MKEKELCRIRGKEISMIFQNPLSALDPVYTIGDQIVEIIRIHEKISKKEAYEKAVFLLKQVKIPSPEVRIQQYPHELSGGMQQRVMIAIALACNPKVLIADEPTTALDVTIQAQILSLLKELRDQLGIAVILITHNMGVVAAVCDRMLVMYGGAVVEEGKCTELFENPCHPYTRGLLAAIPSIKERKEKLYTIPGQVPKMKVPVQYCRFCSRCSYAQEVCHEKEPGMQGENGHLYKCFYTPQQQEKEKCGPGGGAL
ncbi:MAG: ABC transporter ATP-binding protein [Firmicutes bacterium]|nr:ABC transporter ATP-binding protein [Bacillota bacterium]